MRILLVANGYPPDARGGVETYTQAIGSALLARGHVVEVFCRVSAPRESEYSWHRAVVDGIPVRRAVNDLTDATRFEDHYRNPRFDDLFRDQVQEFEPNLVHIQHCVGLSATLMQVAGSLGLPTVVTLHDYWFICPRATLFNADRIICAGPQSDVDCVTCLGGVNLSAAGALVRWPGYKQVLARLPRRLNVALRSFLLEWGPTVGAASNGARDSHRRQMRERTEYLLGLLRQADKCLVPSEFVKQVFAAHGLAAERVDVLPLGIDMPARPRRPDAPQAVPVIGFIGSLQFHKGPDVVVSAFRAAGDLAAELRLYGQGDLQDVYMDQLRAAAAGDDRIRFMGPFQRENLPDILAGLDLLVVASRWHETYSLAAREALLAGVPVIATNLGALPDAIQDGVNGYLVPPGDVPALAAVLRRAVAQGADLKAGARRSAPAPTLAEHVAQLEKIYLRLLEPAG